MTRSQTWPLSMLGFLLASSVFLENTRFQMPSMLPQSLPLSYVSHSASFARFVTYLASDQ